MIGFRLTIFASALANYTIAFFRALALEQGCPIQLVFQPIRTEAPYQGFDLSFCQDIVEDLPTMRATLEKRVRNFRPDVILMCSWNYKHYMRLCRRLRQSGVYVVAAGDNQWLGTWRQWLGVIISPWYLKSAIDTLYVCGDRQASFAHKLGFGDPIYGLYSPDISSLLDGPSINDRPPTFLYVGRLIPSKGIQNLAQAYTIYRHQCEKPWDLIVAGVGMEQQQFDGLDGVHCLGFVQPNNLPNVLHSARCLTLSSIWEPWGVVIHEAAASGLAIICTQACGAGTNFVRDGVNGYVIGHSVEQLALTMRRIAGKTPDELLEMSRASRLLGSLWDNHKAAKGFVEACRERHT